MRNALYLVGVAQLVLLFVAGQPPAGLVPIRFNDEYSGAPTDTDGPWPTIPMLYGSSSQLDVYPTFWNDSVFITPQTCSDDISNASMTTLLCADNLTLHQSFYNGPLPSVTNLSDEYIGYSLAWQNTTDGHTSGYSSLWQILLMEGFGSQDDIQVTVQDMTLTTPAVIGKNLTTKTSNSTRPTPLLNSLISVPNLAADLAENNTTASEFFGLHLGSVDPYVPASLVAGGYDNARIIGDLVNFTTFQNYAYSESNLGIANITIGVEEGFLPLQSLAFINGSFPQGHYSIDPSRIKAGRNSVATNVWLDPGLSTFVLPQDICDPIADVLGLSFDKHLNLYRWNLPEDHPIFRSPTFLGFSLVGLQPGEYPASDDDSSGVKAQLSVKIPFTLLQHRLHITTTDADGTRTQAQARYFPCRASEWQAEDVSLSDARLGRAFLQAAFVGANFDQQGGSAIPSLWIGQAPGPDHLEEDLRVPESGVLPPRNGTRVEANAWTKSWASRLPIWTIDADGQTTLAELNQVKQEGMSRSQKLAVIIGSSIGGAVVLATALFFLIKAIIKARRKAKRIRREMREEDATARLIESLTAEKWPLTAEESSDHGPGPEPSRDARDSPPPRPEIEPLLAEEPSDTDVDEGRDSPGPEQDVDNLQTTEGARDVDNLHTPDGARDLDEVAAIYRRWHTVLEIEQPPSSR